MKNLLATLALTGLLPLSASAKPYHFTHVSWIVENRNNLDVDDHYVTLIGHVTRRIGGESYWFADSTGQIRLDSENFDLPIGRTIVVGGRIDEAYLGFGHIEVDVRRWHYPEIARTTSTTTSTTHQAPAAPVHAAASEPAPSTSTTAAAPAPEKPSLAPAPEPAAAPAPAPEPAPVATSVPATSSAATAAATAASEASTNSVATSAPQPAAVTNAAPLPPSSTNTP